MLQNVLRELEQKKPQLDELVHTAEHLKADSNRQQLHGKGKRTQRGLLGFTFWIYYNDKGGWNIKLDFTFLLDLFYVNKSFFNDKRDSHWLLNWN